MDATDVLKGLREKGIVVVPDGDRLRFRPQHAITPELRTALIEHKVDILRILGHDWDSEVGWRAEAMRPQVPRTGAIPLLLARPGARTASPGACVSCADPLVEGRVYRCAPCAVRDRAGGERGSRRLL